jgi:hypothetical protein
MRMGVVVEIRISPQITGNVYIHSCSLQQQMAEWEFEANGYASSHSLFIGTEFKSQNGLNLSYPLTELKLVNKKVSRQEKTKLH